jgi:hypothetical protein
MPSKFRIRVEDNKTHKRGRVTFVYSEIERRGEIIEVLFNGRDEAVDVSVDSVRKVLTRQCLNETVMSAVVQEKSPARGGG